jgi:pilus assembly protein CpaF
MIKLTITEKGGEPKALTFDKNEISIGRVTGNDIVLPKGNVSKRHSKITIRDGSFEVSDLKSTNGTYVNGRKISETVNVTGADKVYVGDFMIVLEGPEAAISEGNGHNDAGSASRRLPVPPPPPPARGGSSLGRLPSEGGSDLDEDDESLGLAVRPPRAGRLPPPPPPPRRTPMGNPLVELDDDAAGPSASDAGALADDGANGAPSSEVDPAHDETGAQGGPALFEHGPTRSTPNRGDDEDDDDDRAVEAFRESPITNSRHPGAGTGAMRTSPDVAPRIATPPGRGLSESGPSPTLERGDRSGRNGSVNATDVGDSARVAEALDKLMADATVSAILINGPDSTLIERNGALEPFSGPFSDPNAIADIVWRLATTAVPPPPPDNPVVDVRLVDGTRISAAFPPAAPAGICAVIRKPALPERSLVELNPNAVTPSEVQVVLESALIGLRNILVTGDVGAVTAVLGALAATIPSDRRVVSVGGGLGRTRAGWTELTNTADMGALIRVASAFRPDQLLIGETAGPEILDILLAAARGQEGVVFGMPARSATEALVRLEALAARNSGASGVAQLAGTSIDLLVHAVSLAGGGVRIAEVAELKLDATGKLALDPALIWRSDGGLRSNTGVLDVIGVSARLGEALAARGHSLPPNLVRRAGS